nr:MAG TPA: hypothetical protein [Bacteriophage sp.]
MILFLNLFIIKPDYRKPIITIMVNEIKSSINT